jgi:phosphatidylglycerol:prolipoprotein diacylglycerol transferase
LGVPLCPTQPVSAVANFLIAGVLYLLYRKRKAPGEIFGFYLIFYGIFRFLIEFLRATPKELFGLFSNNQVISIIMVAVGTFIVLNLRRRPK